MGLFCQNENFSNALVVLKVRVQALVVRGAIRKIPGSLGAKL
jgi:hypothetical protein